MGCLNSAPSSSDYKHHKNHASNRRQRMHAGAATSMQHLVLLPSLPLVDRGQLFVQSRARMICKDGACAERYPKRDPERYPKDIQNLFKSAPADQLVTKQDVGIVCRRDRLRFYALAGCILKNTAVSGQNMPAPTFFSKDLLVWEIARAAQRRNHLRDKHEQKPQVCPNACKKRSAEMRIQVDALQKYA